MKFYLAGRFSRIDEINAVKADLESVGHHVTSRWLLGNHKAENDQLDDPAVVRFADEDFDDVVNSEAMILFTEEPRSVLTRGGRMVEFGMGLLRNRLGVNNVSRNYPVFVVGPKENVFCCLSAVTWYPDWETCALHSFGIMKKGGSQ